MGCDRTNVLGGHAPRSTFTRRRLAPGLGPRVAPLLNARLVFRLDPLLTPLLDPWLVPLLDARLAPLLNARLVFRLDPLLAPLLDARLAPLLDARLISRLAPLLGARLVALLDTGCQTTLRGCLMRQRSHGTACTLIRRYGPAARRRSVPVLDDDALAGSIV